MTGMGATVGSKRVALVEALVANHRTGLTIPQLVRASKVPRMTAHRIMGDFRNRGLVYAAARKGKADVFRLVTENSEVVGLAKATNAFTLHVAETKARAHATKQLADSDYVFKFSKTSSPATFQTSTPGVAPDFVVHLNMSASMVEV